MNRADEKAAATVEERGTSGNAAHRIREPEPILASKTSAESADGGSGAGGMAGVVRQTGLYGLGAVLGKALGVVMLPVYTRFLTPADYGVMELISMTLDVIMIVAGAQMLSGIYRFYHKAAAPSEKSEVVVSTLLLLLGSYGLMGTATFVAASALSRLIFDTAAHADLIRVAGATLVLTPLMSVPQAYHRLRDQAGIFISANLSKLCLAAGINVALLLMGMGVMAIFVSAMVTTALIGAVLTIRVLHQTGLRASADATRNLVRFGWPLVIMNVATFIFMFGDRYFLQRHGGATAVGLYMFGYQFGFILMEFGHVPFMGMWGPRRFAIAKQDDRDALLSQGFVYLNVLLSVAAAGMVLFINDFFRIMATPPFYPAAAFVPLILLAFVFHSWAGIQNIGILVTERTSVLSWTNWVAAGVAVLGYALLIPRYGGWGAVEATLITFVVRYLLTFVWSQRLWPVRYDWVPVAKLFALAAIVALIGMGLPHLPIIASLAVRSLVFLGYLALVWNAGILAEADRKALRERMHRSAGAAFRYVKRTVTS